MAGITSSENLNHKKQQEKRAKRGVIIDKVDSYIKAVGLGWFASILRILNGDSSKTEAKVIWQGLGVPAISIIVFLALWGWFAPQVKTSLGTIPGPVQVAEQFGNLIDDHYTERAKAVAFYERQTIRNEKKLAADPNAKVKIRTYTGKATYLDQIWTSLKTVFAGFLLAIIVAIPLGILSGLSKTMSAAINPIVQIFKPVSPLAWLPIVTMVVSAVYVSDNPFFEKAFITSAVTVTLCSLWPTLVNTAVGVASIDKDLLNVGRVLKLTTWVKIRKLIIPSSLPYIFTGMRMSLSVGWMVLIAAEMLAQNPGLGKFVWDEFQNGSSNSLAKIMAAVLTIGIIGFLLDRMMMAIEAVFTKKVG